MQIGCGGYANWLLRLCKLLAEAMQIVSGGNANWLWRLCKLVAKAMWSLPAIWTVNNNNNRDSLCGVGGLSWAELSLGIVCVGWVFL